MPGTQETATKSLEERYEETARSAEELRAKLAELVRTRRRRGRTGADLRPGPGGHRRAPERPRTVGWRSWGDW